MEATETPTAWDPDRHVEASDLLAWLREARGLATVTALRIAGDGAVTATFGDPAQEQAVRAALLAFDPAAPPPVPEAVRAARLLVAQVRGFVDDIEAVPLASRTPVQRALLATMRLELLMLRRLWQQAEETP